MSPIVPRIFCTMSNISCSCLNFALRLVRPLLLSKSSSISEKSENSYTQRVKFSYFTHVHHHTFQVPPYIHVPPHTHKQAVLAPSPLRWASLSCFMSLPTHTNKLSSLSSEVSESLLLLRTDSCHTCFPRRYHHTFMSLSLPPSHPTDSTYSRLGPLRLASLSCFCCAETAATRASHEGTLQYNSRGTQRLHPLTPSTAHQTE